MPCLYKAASQQQLGNGLFLWDDEGDYKNLKQPMINSPSPC